MAQSGVVEHEREVEEGGLLSPDRVRVAGPCWIVFAAIAYVADLWGQTRDHLTNGAGRPFGDDFINYWSGAYLAWHGRAADIYDWSAFHVFEQQTVGAHLQYYHYSYPPVLFLLTAPLAVIPYVPALGIWLLSSWYAFYRALKLTASRHALVLALATPAVFINAVGGQNGMWTAVLLGGGLVLVDRRPVVAGILLGLLIYKPHLGVMLPVALLAGRRWQTIIAAAITAIGLVGVSIAIFGTAMWSTYAGHAEILRAVILEDGMGVWHRMVSVFVFARRLGLDVHAAYVVQIVAAVPAAIFVARAWWKDESPEIRSLLVILGTCLATPYLQDYDLVMGAFVAVWLGVLGERSGLAAWPFRLAAALVLLLPLFAAPVGKLTGIAPGPLFIAPVFALVAVFSVRGASKPPVA